MRLRWKWIIGLIGLVSVGSATAQKAGDSAKDGGTPVGDGEVAAEANATETTTKPTLTGIPQIDYIHDPNLPHEVRGFDLSEYPFYSKLPEDLLLPSFNFSCDDRHDGFYASVPHKCQVYHNCLFGQRYDFLCANYTVFDQKNFICHYVSEVDCANSARHYDRNDELYETTTTTTTTRAPPQVVYVERPRPLRGPGLIRPNRPRPFAGNRPRPFAGNNRPLKRRTTTTPAPAYYDDYYYDNYYDQYYDYYYNDYADEKTTTTTTTTTQRPRRPNRPQRQRLGGQGGAREGAGGELRSRPSGRFGNVFSVKDRKRPRINPPVPVDDESSGQRPRASRLQQSPPPRDQAVEDDPVEDPRQDIGQNAPSGPRRRRPGGRKPRPGGRPPKKTTTTTTTTTTEAAPEDEYYDDDYYYDYADEPSTTPSTTAAPARGIRPSSSRTRSRGGSQRRPQEPPSTTTTTTEEPLPNRVEHGSPDRPSRVNVRRNPISNRNPPVSEDVPAEERPAPASTQETSASQRERPQRLRPQFPRKRPQGQSGFGGRQEAEIVEEDAPLAPGVDLPGNEAPSGTLRDQVVSETSDNAQSRSRAPIRRLGQGRPDRQRSGQRRRPTPVPDYYDY